MVVASGLLQCPGAAAAPLPRQDRDLLHSTLNLFLAEMQEIKAFHFQAMDASLNQTQPHSSGKHPHGMDPEHDAQSFKGFIFQPAELIEYV